MRKSSRILVKIGNRLYSMMKIILFNISCFILSISPGTGLLSAREQTDAPIETRAMAIVINIARAERPLKRCKLQ
ncbi:Uncharacterised protein [Mycobacterium tuberculosis]|nr:Uncharacterised protein [Mycobacterium tuberculosis]